MAVCLEISKSDLTVCSICEGKIKKPKQLPCLHTFCESCLNKYVTSSYDKNKFDTPGFLCPECGIFTSAPKTEASLENWAELFPVSSLVSSLLEGEKASEKDKECDWCLRANNKIKAEHWCNGCVEALCAACKNIHHGFKVFTDHVIISLADISETSTIHPSSDIFCSQHAGKKVEIYCFDHELPCCVLCMFDNHKQCEHTKPIEKASAGIRDSEEFRSLEESFQCLSKELQNDIDIRQEKKESLKDSKLKMENEIQCIRKQINDHLDKLEDKLRDGVSSECELEIDTFEIQAQTLKQRKSIADNCIRIMKVAREKISDDIIFTQLKHLKSNEENLKKFMISDTARFKDIDINLELSEWFKDFETKVETLGKVVKREKTEAQTPVFKTPIPDFLSATPKLIGFFSECDTISGAVFLPNKGSLIVDCVLYKITLLDENFKSLSSLRLSSKPWDVTLVSTNKAVITMLGNKKLAYIEIDVVSQSMKLIKTVDLKGECRGICVLDQTLLVSYPKQLNILDLNGSFIKVVNVDLGYIVSVAAVDKNNIYLSDNGRNCLICIDIHGKIMYNYSPNNLERPNKITIDSKENIYVAGWKTNNFHQLTKDGKLARLLPLEIQKPLCVEFEKNSSRFLVTSEKDKCVSFFEMTES